MFSIYKAKTPVVLLALTACFMLCGCSSNASIEPVEKICTAGDKQAAMTAARAVLSEMQFDIDKLDNESGFIVTKPLAAAQGFEFWRKDTIGKFNKKEAAMHSLRKTAQIGITQDASGTCVECMVKTERLNMPKRDVSQTQTYKMFSSSTYKMQNLELSDSQKRQMQWVDLGPDQQLSSFILKKIEQKLQKP